MIGLDYYKGKKVLVTGHTGFKGSWLSIWLKELGAEIIGYGLDPYTERDNFILSGLSNKIIDIRGDIRDLKKLETVFEKNQPDIVFHLAAQPLVRYSYQKPLYTYDVNVMGTLNVLECVRSSKSVKSAVFITTDKCYENKEQLWGYRENDPLGGFDPYSSSKGACEIAINSWRNSFFNTEKYDTHGKSIASVRAGNVIGGGDWAEDRIIPDCIRSIESNRPIEIRNPEATRPWEHVLEPLSGYLLLGSKMAEDPIKYSEGWNFGPEYDSIVTVKELVDKVITNYGKGRICDVSDHEHPHEAALLALDISKAKSLLGWFPSLNIDQTVQLTVDWYKGCGKNMYDFCVEQIKSNFMV